MRKRPRRKTKAAPEESHAFAECPPRLSPTAREVWYRIVPELMAWNVLQKADREQLVLYCTASALWSEAVEALQKYGMVMKSPNGHPIQSPYVSIANQQASIMTQIAGEFGFSPGSRRRLHIRTEQESDSSLLELEPLPSLD